MSSSNNKPAMNAFAALMSGAKKPQHATNGNGDTPASLSASSSAADLGVETNATAPTAMARSTSAAGTSSFFGGKAAGAGVGAGPRHSIDEKNQPWVEKYRPKNLGEVSAQDHTVAVLKKTLESANLPHMLFYGPPGTGKTSTVLALCKQLFGPELYRSRVLELNASDERGITVVREKIKNFAKTAVTINRDPSYPAPPYKIIILDEADSMTQDAQSALRRIMENHSRITRFCLICNYVTRIIEPITSRCSKFRFKPLDIGNAEARLRFICEKENVNCPDDALQTLIKISDGDLRRAITYLQSASRLHAASESPLTPLSIQEIGGVVPDHVMNRLGTALGVTSTASTDDVEMKDRTTSSRAGPSEFEKVQNAVETIAREGYSATQVLLQLHDLLILDPLVSPRAKAKIALYLGETDKCLTDGADEELQLLNCCTRIRKAIQEAA